jgi:hypothetical protein
MPKATIELAKSNHKYMGNDWHIQNNITKRKNLCWTIN